MITQAIILAGGKGERLRPLTDDRPKPMVEINDKPILQYIIDNLTDAGVKEIVFACSYKHEVIEEYVGDGSKFGIIAKYSIEDEPLGRGGGIKKAMDMLADEGQDILVMNGDQLWKVNLEGLQKLHQDRDALATLVVVPLRSQFGIVDSNQNGEIIGFREKPELPYWINAGIYVFSKEIRDLLPDVGDHEVETFPKLEKDRFLVFESREYWRGVDTVKDKTEAEKEAEEVFSE